MRNRSRRLAASRMEPDTNLSQLQQTDEQRSLISNLFKAPKPELRGGRPRADVRRCREGILWVLRSGARWKDLPRSYPLYVSCWRRFVECSDDGVWTRTSGVWSRCSTGKARSIGNKALKTAGLSWQEKRRSRWSDQAGQSRPAVENLIPVA